MGVFSRTFLGSGSHSRHRGTNLVSLGGLCSTSLARSLVCAPSSNIKFKVPMRRSILRGNAFSSAGRYAWKGTALNTWESLLSIHYCCSAPLNQLYANGSSCYKTKKIASSRPRSRSPPHLRLLPLFFISGLRKQGLNREVWTRGLAKFAAAKEDLRP